MPGTGHLAAEEWNLLKQGWGEKLSRSKICVEQLSGVLQALREGYFILHGSEARPLPRKESLNTLEFINACLVLENINMMSLLLTAYYRELYDFLCFHQEDVEEVYHSMANRAISEGFR